MNKQVLYLGAILIAIFSINSCDLEDLANVVSMQDITNASPTVADNMEIQAKIIDVFENVNNLIDVSDLKSLSMFGDEPEVTGDGNTYTFDFTNVTNSSGTIVVAFSGEPSILTLNLSATIAFNNYESDNSKFNGSMELNVNPTLIATINYNLKSVNSLDIESGDENYEWGCDYLIKWTNGITTLDNSIDDVYFMSGTSTQVKENGTNTFKITEDLMIANDCEYIKKGVIEVAINENNSTIELVVDFGIDADGNNSNACDAFANISAGSLSLPVEF